MLCVSGGTWFLPDWRAWKGNGPVPGICARMTRFPDRGRKPDLLANGPLRAAIGNRGSRSGCPAVSSKMDNSCYHYTIEDGSLREVCGALDPFHNEIGCVGAGRRLTPCRKRGHLRERPAARGTKMFARTPGGRPCAFSCGPVGWQVSADRVSSHEFRSGFPPQHPPLWPSQPPQQPVEQVDTSGAYEGVVTLLMESTSHNESGA